MKATSRYWIQDSNEYGNYYDSVGLDERTTLKEATKQLKLWRTGFPERNSRLVLRTETVLLDK